MLVAGDPMFDTRLADLPTLVKLGTTELTPNAPWTRTPYSQIEDLRRLVLGTNHRSMETVFDALINLMDKKDAAYAIRVLRPFLPVSIVDWVWVSPQQGCGLAWATTGRPQEEARRAVLTIVEAGTVEANWPAKFPPFTCDSTLSWADYIWAYLKLNYKHLKDPVA
jgi:hypothetical protein